MTCEFINNESKSVKPKHFGFQFDIGQRNELRMNVLDFYFKTIINFKLSSDPLTNYFEIILREKKANKPAFFFEKIDPLNIDYVSIVSPNQLNQSIFKDAKRKCLSFANIYRKFKLQTSTDDFSSTSMILE